uniref:Uncharacterized protein n=1 Tax=Histophilus somni (strain 129Pt) TaxID=205914 RepID=Q0I4Q1_HISS1
MTNKQINVLTAKLEEIITLFDIGINEVGEVKKNGKALIRSEILDLAFSELLELRDLLND